MVTQRGEGIGLEVTRDLIRGARLAHDEPGRLVDVCEVRIDRFDDDEHLRQAFAAARERLHADRQRTRIAWFPGGATLQRIEVTGRGGTELNAIRHDLDERLGISSTMLLEGSARRWMLALGWAHRTAWRLQSLAELAGWIDVEVEPAPLALGRILPGATDIARHASSADDSWAAVYDRSVPLAATALRVSMGDYPSLETGRAVRNARFEDLFALQTQAAVFSNVTDVVGAALDGDGPPAGPTPLQVADHEYPTYPPHDLRAAHRVCVALGAATGAAGLAGLVRAIDVAGARPAETPGVRHPWSVERIVSAPEAPERTPLSWWRRALQAVRSSFRRSIG